MNTRNNKVEVGHEVCFFEGKDERPVTYDILGKVILCKHPISIGYAKLTSVEERDKCYLVTAEHVARDIYSGITYEEFLQVLPLHGFKLGFDRTFVHDTFDNITVDEHQVFAYNPKNRAVIVGETFTFPCEDSMEVVFNSLRTHLPGVSCFLFQRNRMFHCGGRGITVLDAGSTSRNEFGILEYTNMVMSKYGGRWPKDEYPSLWTYEKSDNKELDEEGNWILGKWSLQRLKLADPECLKIFEGCDWLKELI